MKKVVIGLLGTVIDAGKGDNRWNLWRPTVALCQHEDLVIDRLELLCQRKYLNIAKTVINDIKQISPETKVVLNNIEYKDPWDFEEMYEALHNFARSYRFDTEKEEYFIHITTGTHVAQICEFLLTESHYFPARLLQVSPPKRKNLNEPGSYSIIDLDLSKYDRIAARFGKQACDDISFLKSGIETRNNAFNTLIEKIEKVATNSTYPILLTGPTGAGKSKLARQIYELKKAKKQVKGGFVEVNCATLRGDAAMSCLFGHKKGSFTGAVSDRAGLLCAADAGILFLDEIGELGTDEQAMLLRAIEDKKFLPVGSDIETQSNFQLICGTNRNLNFQVQKGLFREDLLSRINLWTFAIPALRHRPEDIEPNIKYELERYSQNFGVSVSFNKEAWQKFISFATGTQAIWAANFRDLNASIARMSTLTTGGRITESIVQEEIERLMSLWSVQGQNNLNNNMLEDILGHDKLAQIDLFDTYQLEAVLRVCRDCRNISEAGRKLFNVSRLKKNSSNDADRLRKYISRFGITLQDIYNSQT